MTGKQAIKQLRAAGFEVLRTRGSHHILGNGKCRVTVPVHGATDLKPGALNSIENNPE